MTDTTHVVFLVIVVLVIAPAINLFLVPSVLRWARTRRLVRRYARRVPPEGIGYGLGMWVSGLLRSGPHRGHKITRIEE